MHLLPVTKIDIWFMIEAVALNMKIYGDVLHDEFSLRIVSSIILQIQSRCKK